METRKEAGIVQQHANLGMSWKSIIVSANARSSKKNLISHHLSSPQSTLHPS